MGMENVADTFVAILEAFNYRLTGILVAAAFVILLLWLLSTWRKRDEREPPIVNTWIPHIGHVVNLFYFGQHYLEDLWYSSFPSFGLYPADDEIAKS